MLTRCQSVFVCYDGGDRTLATRVAQAIRSYGYQVSFDRTGLTHGQAYDRPLRRLVTGSAALVFLASPSSVADGHYCRTELGWLEKTRPNPEGRVVVALLHGLPRTQLPAYVQRIVPLRGEGDLPAELAAAVDDLLRKGRVTRLIAANVVALIGTGVLLARPDDGAAPELPRPLDVELTLDATTIACSAKADGVTLRLFHAGVLQPAPRVEHPRPGTWSCEGEDERGHVVEQLVVPCGVELQPTVSGLELPGADAPYKVLALSVEGHGWDGLPTTPISKGQLSFEFRSHLPGIEPPDGHSDWVYVVGDSVGGTKQMTAALALSKAPSKAAPVAAAIESWCAAVAGPH